MLNKEMIERGKNASAIRELFAYAQKRKKEIGEDKVFDFSIGNPSVPAPKEVKENLINMLNTKSGISLHGYTNAKGNDDVRDAIADSINKKYNTNESGKYIYMTCGASAALTSVFNAILLNGEEIIVVAPFFPEYRVYIEHAGGKLVSVNADPTNFEPSVSEISASINEHTKAVVINYPNNPTGATISTKRLIELSKMMKEKEKEYHHDIYLISDEPYRELCFDNEVYPFPTKYYDNTIVCYSYSKSLSLPGERIGYVLVGSNCHEKEELMCAITGAGRVLGFVCAPAMFQNLIAKCSNITSDLSIYKINRDLLYSNLLKIGYEMVKPKGAFYIFLKALEEDANKFSEIAKKFELLLVPSDSFGYKGYVRIAYCVSTKQIEDSIPAFKALYQYYNK